MSVGALVLLFLAIGAAGPSDLSTAELIARSKDATRALGTYRLSFEKNERIGGAMTGAQTMELLIRPRPLAILGTVVAGPNKGRRFLYNATLRADEVRVQEAGVLALAGGFWLGVDHAWTREDTNHRVTELGLAPVLGFLQRDVVDTPATRTEEPADPDGSWCTRFVGPRVANGVKDASALVCFDPMSHLVRRVELRDPIGVFEDVRFRVLERGLKVDDAAFTVAGANL